MKFKYDWGQEVRVIATAPAESHPSQLGSVCGMREIGGRRLYLVEFADGETIEIQEDSIEIDKGE